MSSLHTDRTRPSDCNASARQSYRKKFENHSYKIQLTPKVKNHSGGFEFIIFPDISDLRKENSIPIINLAARRRRGTAVRDLYQHYRPHNIGHTNDWKDKGPKQPGEPCSKEKQYAEGQVCHQKCQNIFRDILPLCQVQRHKEQFPITSSSWHSGVRFEIQRENTSAKGRFDYREHRRDLKQKRSRRKKLCPLGSGKYLRKSLSFTTGDSVTRETSTGSLRRGHQSLTKYLNDFSAFKYKIKQDSKLFTELNIVTKGELDLSASGNALNSIRVTYEMGDPPIPSISTTEKRDDAPGSHEPNGDYDQAYDTAFDFANKYDYGFVEFVEDTPRKMPRQRRPFSMAKLARPRCNNGLQQHPTPDRNNPVYITKPDKVPLDCGRRVCKNQSTKEAVLDHMGIMESARKDIDMIRKVSDELGKFTFLGSQVKSLSPKRFRKSPTKRRGWKNNRSSRGTPSPKRSIPSSRPASSQRSNSPADENDDEIIQSAPLDKYMAYLSRMCEKIYQEPRSNKKHANNRTTRGANSSTSKDTVNAPDFFQSENISNLNSSKLCERKAGTTMPESNLHTGCPAILSDKDKMSNIIKHRNATLDVNKSKNNGPSTCNFLSTLVDESPEEDEQVVLRLPKIGEKVNRQYKLYNSMSATIYRESQLAKKNLSQTERAEHLPTSAIDVVQVQEQADDVTDEEEQQVSTDFQHVRKCRTSHEVTRWLRAPQGSKETSSITRIRCPHKGSQIYQLQCQGSRDLHKYKRGSDKADSCPNLAMHVGSCQKKTKPLPSRSPISACGTKLFLTEGHLVTDSEMASHMSTENKFPVKGDGIISETNETTSSFSFSKDTSFREQCNDKTTGSNLSHKSHTESLKKISASLLNPSGDGEVTQLPYPVNSSPAVVIRETEIKKAEVAVTEDGFSIDTYKEQSSTNNNVSDAFQKDHAEIYGECSQAKNELAKEELSKFHNSNNNSLPSFHVEAYSYNNNSLPEMELSPGKSKISSVSQKERGSPPHKQHSNTVRPDPVDDQPLRLPVLSTHQHSTAGCHDKVYATFNTCGNEDTFIPIPPANLPPKPSNLNRNHKGKRNKAESDTKGLTTPDKNEAATAPDVPLSSRDSRQFDKIKEKRHVKWPARLSPVHMKRYTSKSPDQCSSSENQTKDTANLVSKLETLKTRPLNRSYVICEAENNENTCGDDNFLPGPDQNLGTNCKRKLMENQNCFCSHHRAHKTEEPPVKPVATITPTQTCTAAKNKNYIPKPITSSKSPEFAATRHNFEETRETVGFKPGKYSSKNTSPSNFSYCHIPVEHENTNNNGISGEYHLKRIESQMKCDRIMSVSECISSPLASCISSCTPEQNHNCNAILKKKVSPSPRTNKALSQGSSNNSSHSHNIPLCFQDERMASADEIGLQLERELMSLIRDTRQYRANFRKRPLAPPFSMSRIHLTDSLSDINESNFTRRSNTQRASSEDHASSLLGPQARHREFMRRRCIRSRHLDEGENEQCSRLAAAGERGERRVGDEEQIPLVAASGNQYSLGTSSFLPMSRHQSPESSDYGTRPCQQAQMQQSIPYCPTTENYWDVARNPSSGNGCTLQSSLFTSGAQRDEYVTPNRCNGMYEEHMQGHAYKSQQQTGINEEHMEHENEQHDRTDVMTPVANLEKNMASLYRHFDALWLRSQNEVSQQLKSINESFNQRLGSLQKFVHENFQKTHNLIVNDAETNSTPSTNSSVCTKKNDREKAKAIQLNTSKSKKSGPSYGFPLDISKYETRDGNEMAQTVKRAKTIAKSESNTLRDSSGTSGNTFPTIHFAEVTPESQTAQCNSWEIQTSCQTPIVEDSTPKSTSYTQERFHIPHITTVNRSPLRSTAQNKPGNSGHHARTSRKVTPVTKGRRKASPSTYKSIKQWKQEVNNPVIKTGKYKGRLKKTRYRRNQHTRSCRRRQRLEGNCCNMCLPHIQPQFRLKRKITKAKRKRYDRIHRPGRTHRKSQKLSQKSPQKSKRKTVRFEINHGARRKTRPRKLRSPVLKKANLLLKGQRSQRRKRLKKLRNIRGAQIAKRGRLANKTCNHKKIMKEMTRARGLTNQPGAKTWQPKKSTRHSKKRAKMPVKRKRRSPRQNELYNKLLKRYQNLQRKIATMTFLYGQSQCPSCFTSYYKKNRMVNQFLSLLSRLPKSRLKTLETILASCERSTRSSHKADYRVSRTSPEKPMPDSHESPNKSANAHRLHPVQSSTKIYQGIGNDCVSRKLKKSLSRRNVRGQTDAVSLEEVMHRGGRCTNYIGQMRQRPGFYFFKTLKGRKISQPLGTRRETVRKVTGQETPRPVDSLQPIRKNLNKEKDTSRNAQCIYQAKTNDFPLIEDDSVQNEKSILRLDDQCHLGSHRIIQPEYNRMSDKFDDQRQLGSHRIIQPEYNRMSDKFDDQRQLGSHRIIQPEYNRMSEKFDDQRQLGSHRIIQPEYNRMSDKFDDQRQLGSHRIIQPEYNRMSEKCDDQRQLGSHRIIQPEYNRMSDKFDDQRQLGSHRIIQPEYNRMSDKFDDQRQLGSHRIIQPEYNRMSDKFDDQRQLGSHRMIQPEYNRMSDKFDDQRQLESHRIIQPEYNRMSDILDGKRQLRSHGMIQPAYNGMCEHYKTASSGQVCQSAPGKQCSSDATITLGTMLNSGSHSRTSVRSVERRRSQRRNVRPYSTTRKYSREPSNQVHKNLFNTELNNTSEGYKRMPMVNKLDGVQPWQLNILPKPRSSEQFVEGMKQSVADSRTKFSGKILNTPNYSHHTGIFNVNKIDSHLVTENCQKSDLEEMPIRQMNSFDMDESTFAAQTTEEEIRMAVSKYIDQKKKLKDNEQLQVNIDAISNVERPQSVCHQRKETTFTKFTNSLWEGFETYGKDTEKNFKVSHLLSSENKDCRSSSQNISSATTSSISCKQNMKVESLSGGMRSLHSVKVKVSKNPIKVEDGKLLVNNKSDKSNHTETKAYDKSVSWTPVLNTEALLSQCPGAGNSSSTQLSTSLQNEITHPLPTLVLRFRPSAKNVVGHNNETKVTNEALSAGVSPDSTSERIVGSCETVLLPGISVAFSLKKHCNKHQSSVSEGESKVQVLNDSSDSTIKILESDLETEIKTRSTDEGNNLTNTSPMRRVSFTHDIENSEGVVLSLDKKLFTGSSFAAPSDISNSVENSPGISTLNSCKDRVPTLNTDCTVKQDLVDASVSEICGQTTDYIDDSSASLDQGQDYPQPHSVWAPSRIDKSATLNNQLSIADSSKGTFSEYLLADGGYPGVANAENSVCKIDVDAGGEVRDEETSVLEQLSNTHRKESVTELDITVSKVNLEETHIVPSDQVENNSSCRWLFEQPYLIVNTPGLSTTWTSFVPEPGNPHLSSRNSPFQIHDTVKRDSSCNIWPGLVATATNWLRNMEYNRNGNTVPSVQGSAISLSFHHEQASADVENVPVSVTRGDSATTSVMTNVVLLCPEEQRNPVPSRNVYDGDCTRAESSNITNSVTPSQSCGVEITSSQITENQSGSRIEQSVDFINEFILQGLRVSVMSDESNAGLVSSATSTENNNNAINVHNELESCQTSVFESRGGQKNSGKNVGIVTTHNSNNETSKMDTASSQSSQSDKQTILKRVNKLIPTNKPRSKMMFSPRQHSFYYHERPTNTDTSRTSRKAIFNNWNNTKTRIIQEGSRKRCAAAPLSKWMAPPRKTRRMGSRLLSLSPLLSCRRESAALRRARWQLVREIRYQKYRKEEKARLGVRRHRVSANDRTVPPPMTQLQSYSSDADSESSL